MDTLSYRTVSVNASTINKQWILVDAENQTLGRLASKVAKIIRGKHKATFTPNIDCGDNVVVINAERVKLSGNKLTEKQYIRHTGHPGGQRFATPKEVLASHPERVIQMAVKGMLPKNRLGSKLLTNLYVYAGTEHKQEAQQPKLINLNTIK